MSVLRFAPTLSNNVSMQYFTWLILKTKTFLIKKTDSSWQGAIIKQLKLFYYRSLQEWNNVKEYLMDICLTAQDSYKSILNYFEIEYK